MSRSAAIARATRHYDDGSCPGRPGAPGFAIPTTSQEPENFTHLRRYLADEIGPTAERLGYRVTIHDNPVPKGGPFLVAARIEDPRARPC